MSAATAADKGALRREMLARRAQAVRPGDMTGHLEAALGDHRGRPLAGYAAMRGEIDPLPLLARWDGPVCLPVVPGKGRPLVFRAWTPGAPLVPGAFGALVPEAGEEVEPEALIVPLVAFTGRGDRLGYGGGFYDRTLERLRRRAPVAAIGFAWAAQQVPALPLEPTDQPLDAVATEAGLVRPPARA